MTKANLPNKGYHLFTDNFYTKPVLAQTLLDAGTMLTGTIRGNSRGIPVVPTKMDVAEVRNCRREGMLLVAFSFQVIFIITSDTWIAWYTVFAVKASYWFLCRLLVRLHLWHWTRRLV